MNERIKLLAEREADNRKRIADLTDTPIKELAVSSGIYDCITDPYDKLKNGDQYSSVMPDLVRFAELIVKECMQVARKSISEDEPNEAWYLIKEHFRIEE